MGNLLEAKCGETLRSDEAEDRGNQIPRPDVQPRPDDHPCDEFWQVVAYRDSTREYWVEPLRVPNYVPAT